MTLRDIFRRRLARGLVMQKNPVALASHRSLTEIEMGTQAPIGRRLHAAIALRDSRLSRAGRYLFAARRAAEGAVFRP
jgi:hypothetical protein